MCGSEHEQLWLTAILLNWETEMNERTNEKKTFAEFEINIGQLSDGCWIIIIQQHAKLLFFALKIATDQL